MNERQPTVPGIRLDLPGGRRLCLEHVVFDFNGTLAVDGKLVRGVARRLRKLATLLAVVVMTADTFGTARRALAGLPLTVHVVRGGTEKRRYVDSVGRKTVAAIGNGVNDVPMFRAAALGIAVCGAEGTSGELLRVATIFVRDVNNACDLLVNPRRIVATLRR